MKLQASARSDTGRVRANNEDAYLMAPPLIAVADGVGGHSAGEVASQIAIDTLGALRDGIAQRGGSALRDAVLLAHTRIGERSADDAALRGMATTLTAAYLSGNTLTVAHVGDSRAYLLRSGSLERATRDHTFVEEMVQSGELSREDAFGHPMSNRVTRALGTGTKIEVDLFDIALQAGDRLLICSDGLHDHVPEETIARLLLDHEDPDAACRALVDEANAAGGSDNITVLVADVELDPDGHDATAADKDLQPAHAAGPPPRPKRRRLVVATVALALAAGLVSAAYLGATLRPGVERHVVAERDGVVVVVLSRGLDAGALRAAQTVHTSSLSVADLPPQHQRVVRNGILAGDMTEARAVITELQEAVPVPPEWLLHLIAVMRAPFP